MRRSDQVVLKAWMLPLIVVGLVLPGSLAMLLAGPGVGLAVGALCAVALIAAAAMQRPREPIEIASVADGRTHLLIIATEPVEEPEVLEGVLAACGDPDADVLVLAPAGGSALSHWLSDVDPAREDAQVTLVHSLAALAAAGIDARGQVGDADPRQAAEDALRSFPADQVVLVSGDPADDRAVARVAAELGRRLEVPLTQLVAGAAVRR